MLVRFLSTFLICAGAVAWAQATAKPEFEAASIQLAAPFDGDRGNVFINFEETGGPGTNLPGQWTCKNIPLSVLITKAWNAKSNRVSNLSTVPDIRYDVAAKVLYGTSIEDFHLMMQRLLEERLGVKVHSEQVESAVLELVVAKGGIKFKEAEPPPASPTDPPARISWDSDHWPVLPPGRPDSYSGATPNGILTLVGRMQTIADLIRALEGPARRVIVDKTGLRGTYDYRLRFDLGITPGASADAPEPPLLSALPDQLGLKLQPGKAPLEMWFVDEFHKVPSDR